MFICISTYVRAHIGIAVLDGVKGKGMSSPYHLVGGRGRKQLRQALDLKEGGGKVGWQHLRISLLKLEKNVRSTAVGEGYNKDRDRLFLFKLCLHLYA